MPRALRFRPCDRMRRRGDFDRVYATRCSAGHACLVVYVAPNGLGRTRLGLSVGKRVGGAVLRNRWRRRIRAAFQMARANLPQGVDIVCVARRVAIPKTDILAGVLAALAAKAAKRLPRQAAG